jgi:hypothetical protein
MGAHHCKNVFGVVNPCCERVVVVQRPVGVLVVSLPFQLSYVDVDDINTASESLRPWRRFSTTRSQRNVANPAMSNMSSSHSGVSSYSSIRAIAAAKPARTVVESVPVGN